MEPFQSDVIAPELDFSIEEGKGDVDGKHVLAKVKGEFFFPGGVSRNNRFYPKSLWEKVLADEDVQDRIGTRRMFGTISHDQKIDDTAMLEGKLSHVVTNLKIENGKGIGEALILNTPAGRIANTMFRAGSKMFVSSRADGDFNGTQNGIPKVDETSYRLHAFDFVLDPGFLKANPKIQEALNEDFQETFGKSLDEVLENTQPSMPGSEPVITDPEGDEGDPGVKTVESKKSETEEDGGYTMSNELLESLTKDKVSLEGQLAEALQANETLKVQKGVLEGQTKNKETEIEDLKGKVSTDTETSEKLDMLLKDLEDLGSPDEIREAYARTQQHLASVKEAAGTDDMDEVYELLTFAAKVKEEYGDLEDLETAFSMMKEAIATWKEIGAPEEVVEALELAKHMAENSKEEVYEGRATKLAEETGMPVEIVLPMVKDGQDDDEIRGHLKGIKAAKNVQERYRTGPAGEEGKGDGKSGGLMDESQGKRILEGMGQRFPKKDD